MNATESRPRLVEQLAGGAELVVWGDADRERLGRRILGHRDAVTARGLALMGTFLKDSFRPDAFEVVTVEIYAAAGAEHGEFCVEYAYTPDDDPEEFGYTFFAVYFTLHGPADRPWWPFRMSIGFR